MRGLLLLLFEPLEFCMDVVGPLRAHWFNVEIASGASAARVVYPDFYAVVKKPPFKDQNMFIMTVNPCPNGGMWCERM